MLERHKLLLINEADNLEALNESVHNGAKEAHDRVLDRVIDGMQRAKGINPRLPGTGKPKSLQMELESFLGKERQNMKDLMSESEDEADSDGHDFRSSAIFSAIDRTRREVIAAREDEDGRVDKGKFQGISDRASNLGRNFPPRTATNLLGLVRGYEAVRKVISAERSYKKWKRRSRATDRKVVRQLDHDSESS